MTGDLSDGDTVPALPNGSRVVREEIRREDGMEVHVHPEWAEELPWLVQGTTARGEADEPFDLALFGGASRPGSGREIRERWSRLARFAGATRTVHGHQVHRAAVRFHADGPPGLHVSEATDGHATRTPGVLLTVATADCITIALADPVRRAVAALHGGWRGVVAGILERGMGVLGERVASRPGDLHVHLGPAICGRCYEVGPEVHEALGLAVPTGPRPVDLRAAVANRAVAAGVPAGRITVSSACTLCGDSRFFSHRGGSVCRQLGFVAIRSR